MRGWYAVRLLFECRVDGSVANSGLCEESTRLVEAEDERQAREQAQDVGVAAEHSYQNDAGETVSWHFTGIVELQDLGEVAITQGMEVWSRMFRREV